MRTLLAIGGAVLVVALLATWDLRPGKAEEGQTERTPEVKVALARVEQQEIPRYYSSVGTLEAVSQVQVTTEVAGRVSALHFDSGQTIEVGQPLVSLNDAPERAQSLRLKALLRNAERRLQRIVQLLPRHAATQEQLDQARADRDAALGALEEIDALIAQKTVRAPFSGKLGIRKVHLGQYLNPGDPIANLSDNRQLRVNFSLGEQASAELSLGQTVKLRFHSRPDKHIEARINAIDPILDNTRMTRVQASLESGDARLAAGMFADVRILRPSHGATLSIPQTAVVATAYGNMAFVARQEGDSLRAKRVAVRTGDIWGDRVEVLKGLQADERVVVSGQIKLSDGTPLEALADDALQNDSSARKRRP